MWLSSAAWVRWVWDSRSSGTDWSAVVTHTAFPTIAFLALAALLGEIKPLVIARGDEPAESVSTSTPFVFALLTVGGVGVRRWSRSSSPAWPTT